MIKKNEIIGFGVMIVGGILVLKFLGGIISTIFNIAIVGALVYFGFKIFGRK